MFRETLTSFSECRDVVGQSLNAAADPSCEGRFVNPITDVCWLHFPDVYQCLCGGRWRPGYGESGQLFKPAPCRRPFFPYWDGDRLLGADGHDGCQPLSGLHGEYGGFSINLGKTGMEPRERTISRSTGLLSRALVQISADHLAEHHHVGWVPAEGGDMDIAYLSEIDPTWVDSSLTTILNPEAILFGTRLLRACAADAIASAFNKPLDILFWCAGSQGSMYPFSGWVSNESSPLQSSVLLSERMAYKLRQGQIMEPWGPMSRSVTNTRHRLFRRSAGGTRW
jgi:conjugal transfer pilus assembly protein TraU